MNIFYLAYKNVQHNLLSTSLSVLLLALGTSTVSMLYYASNSIENQLVSNLSGADIVVGAKGSPLQIVLSALYQIDAPTGNISLKDAQVFAKNPMVQSAVPLSFGDSYKGYRLVGTDNTYFDWKKAELSKGSFFTNKFDVVVGSYAAEKLGLKIGDTLASSHGVEQKDEEHHHHHHTPYKVVGILNSGYGVSDKLVLCTKESIWELHHSTEEDITALILAVKSPMAIMTLPRMINSSSQLQAALPSIEINRLMGFLGLGFKTLQLLAWCIIVISGISVFISLLNALKDRKVELALLRVLGGKRTSLFWLMCLEANMVVAIGYVVGWLFGRGLLVLFSGFLASEYQTQMSIPFFSSFDLILLLAVIVLGWLAAIVPAFYASRVAISKTLADA